MGPIRQILYTHFHSPVKIEALARIILRLLLICWIAFFPGLSFPLLFAAAKTAPTQPSAACIPVRMEKSFAKVTIAKPGRYCLQEDLLIPSFPAIDSAPGALVNIAASDVVLDLNGHTLSLGWSWRGKGVIGISAGRNLRNITIRNGRIEHFSQGVSIGNQVWLIAKDAAEMARNRDAETFGQSGHVIENVAFEGVDTAVLLQGRNSIVRNNQITGTRHTEAAAVRDKSVNPTGSTPLAGGGVSVILVHGPGNRVENNEINQTAENNGFPTAGIYLRDCKDCVVRSNTLRKPNEDNKSTTGIVLHDSAGAKLLDNRFDGLEKEIQEINDAPVPASGKAPPKPAKTPSRREGR